MTHYTVQFNSAIPELATVSSMERECFKGTLENAWNALIPHVYRWLILFPKFTHLWSLLLPVTLSFALCLSLSCLTFLHRV